MHINNAQSLSRRRRTVFVLIAFLAVSNCGSARAGIDEVIQPFIRKHCISCHDGSEAEGDVSLDQIVTRPRNHAEASVWLKMLEQLQADLMPPFSEERPDRKDRAAVIRAIESLLHESGHDEAYRRKLLMPEYGNWVDHDTLFSGEINTLAYSPSRLWRLSPHIYAASHRNEKASPFVFSTKESGLRDYAPTSSVDQSTIETIIMTVNRKLREEILNASGGTRTVPGRDGPRVVTVRANPRHRYVPFIGEAPPSAEQVARLIKDEFQEVLQRSPTEVELKRYSKFLRDNREVGGQREAMKATVLAIYLCPEAIFRLETGLGPVDEYGRRRLSPDELIYSLGYALADRNPLQDAILTDAISDGRLKTREGVATTVRQLLDRPDTIEGSGSGGLSYTWANPRILRFFREYFGYEQAPKVFKDLTRRKAEFNQRSPSTRMEIEAVRDLDNLIHLIVERDRNVFEELLTTDQFLVGHPGDNELMKQRHADFVERINSGQAAKGRAAQAIAAFAQKVMDRGLVPYEAAPKLFAQINLYDLVELGEGQYWSFEVEQPVKLPNRKGVLTHPAWLWAHSTNFDTDPIHRGIWVYTRLLAGVIPDVPPDVDARVPEDPHKTLRERLDVVKQDFCWKCHRKINPLGETFEIFDDWGRHREQFYFDVSENENDSQPALIVRRDAEFLRKMKNGLLEKRPVDASGLLTGTGDPALDGKVHNAFELIDRLAKSDRARQSFIRHAFRYFLGRNETLNDSQTLIDADRAYQKHGGSFKALVVSLLTSDSFLYRK